MVIITSRGGGKTTQLIRLAAESEGHIVCSSFKEVNRILDIAKEMNLSINNPITYEEFIDKRYSDKGVKNFLIDNVDILIQYMSSVPLTALSFSL